MRIIAWIALALIAAAASAQDTYPSKPIRLLVGAAAGGGLDAMARVMQPEMQKGLGQPVVVENMPGAQSIIAAEAAAKAAPDGYTLLMGSMSTMAINAATYSKLRYSPTRDFAPISIICEFPLLVAVSAASGIRNVKELIAYAKANPGKSNYASNASIFQLTTEMFKQRTGTAIEMIPYKSSGESVQAVVAGQVVMAIADPASATGALNGGTLRALAVTSGKRHPSWPDVPTMAEAGVPDMEVLVWTAFFAPAKTPPAVVARLQKEVARAVQTEEVRARFDKMGLTPVGSSADDLGRRMERDIEKWTAVAKAANIKND